MIKTTTDGGSATEDKVEKNVDLQYFIMYVRLPSASPVVTRVTSPRQRNHSLATRSF